MWFPRRFVRSPRAQRNPHRRRLTVETLEHRCLPAVLLVDNLTDHGTGSLRQAVLDANSRPGNDEILFAAGLQGTIHLTHGEMTITDDLAIHGPGTDRLTLSG